MKIKVRINNKALIAIGIIIVFIIAFIIVGNIIKPSSAKIAPTANEKATSELNANKVYDESTDISLATISSSKNDYSAILVKDEAVVTLRESNIKKYNGLISDHTKQEETGLNSTIAVSYGSKLKITDTKIETTTDYTNGIYASGPKAKVELIDSDILGYGTYSNGIVSSTSSHIEVQHSNITTKFKYSPAVIVTDEKGKVDLMNNVMLETNGNSSPLFKSSGTITMTDSTGNADGSRFAILNGGNVSITNSTLKSAGANDTEEEKASGFQIKGKDKETTLKIKDSSVNINPQKPYFNYASVFDIIETKANITLNNVQLYYGSNNIISMTNSDVKLNLEKQSIKGNIKIDEKSKLSINLKNSSLETSLNTLNTNNNISLSLDNTSTLILNSNIYVKEFNNENKDNNNIILNGYNIFVNGTPIY